MPVIVYVRIDHGSASLRYKVRAMLDGKLVHELTAPPRLMAERSDLHAFREMAAWLRAHGHPVPQSYWLEQFTN